MIAALMLWSDPAFFTAEGNVSDTGEVVSAAVEVGYYSTRTAEGHVGINARLVYFLAITGLMALVSIFLFKNRAFQIRLCVINFIVMLGVFIMMYSYSFAMDYVSLPENQHLEFAALTPIAIAILNYLAIRRIMADDKLVKSLDRLR